MSVANPKTTRFQKGDILFSDFDVMQVYVGGMAEVYCGMERSSGKQYAMKTLKRGREGDASAQVQFDEEVRKWVSIGRHTNIVQCHRFETFRYQPFLALDWVVRTGPNNEPARSDLRSLHRGPIPIERALQIVIDVCHGLLYVATRLTGFVHGDIKPENILVGNDGIARLTDFGFARAARQFGAMPSTFAKRGPRHSTVVSASGGYGTPEYMCRELWEGGQIDSRADIYSIGCCLYEMLTGELAFTASTSEKIRKKHMSQPVPQINASLTKKKDINRILTGCLGKFADDRYSGVDALLLDVESIQAGLDGGTVRSDSQPTEKPEQSDVERHLEEALMLTNLGHHEAALAMLLPLEPLAKEWDTLANNIGLVLRRLGREPQAQKYYAMAAKLNSKDPEHLINLGNAKRAEGDFSGAIRCYDRAESLDPNHPQIYHNRGNVHSAMGDQGSAIWDYTIAIAKGSSEAIAARSASLNLIGLNFAALSDIDRAISLYPLSGIFWQQRSLVLYQLGYFFEAHKADRKQQEVLASGGQLSMQRRGLDKATVHKMESVLTESLDEAKAAIGALNQAGTTNNGSVISRLMRAQLEIAVGEFGSARKGLRSVLESDASSEDEVAIAGYLSGSVCCVVDKDFNGARNCWRVVQGHPQFRARASTAIGETYLLSNRYSDASEYFRLASEPAASNSALHKLAGLLSQSR